MLKVKIEKELDARKHGNSYAEAVESIGKQTQLLLNQADDEDRAIIRDLQLDKNAIEIERQRGINLERAKLDSDWNGKVYEEYEIEALCLAYGLRFLPITDFIGAIDGEVISKIKQFAKENPSTVSTRENQNFIVMAPKECFKLHHPDKTTWTVKDRIKDSFRAYAEDPVLFYRIHARDGSHKYRLIHQWGNEFTIFRKATKWRTQSFKHSFIHWSIMFSLFFMILHVAGSGYLGFGLMFYILIGTLLSMLANGIYYGHDFMNRDFNDTLWNKNEAW